MKSRNITNVPLGFRRNPNRNRNPAPGSCPPKIGMKIGMCSLAAGRAGDNGVEYVGVFNGYASDMYMFSTSIFIVILVNIPFNSILLQIVHREQFGGFEFRSFE